MPDDRPPSVRGEILSVSPIPGQDRVVWAEIAVGAEVTSRALDEKPHGHWHKGDEVWISVRDLFPSIQALVWAMDREFDRRGSFEADEAGNLIRYETDPAYPPDQRWMLEEIFNGMHRFGFLSWPRNIRNVRVEFPSTASAKDGFDLSSQVHAYHLQYGLDQARPLSSLASGAAKAARRSRESVLPRNADSAKLATQRAEKARRFFVSKRIAGSDITKSRAFELYRVECKKLDERPLGRTRFYQAIEDLE